jgi:lipoprotein-anchoring transpeptidase ErfK/SrfK
VDGRRWRAGLTYQAMIRKRWIFIGTLAIIGALLLGGCQSTRRAFPPGPTRTPKPTFTPVREPATVAPTVVPNLIVSADTPTPTPTSSPSPTATGAVVSAMEPTHTPTPITYSSPAAGRVPRTGRAILIDQDQQQMYIFEDGIEVRAIPCSTGDPSNHGTKPWEGVVGKYVGTFESYGTLSDYAWYLFTDLGSILIHGAPYVVDEHGGRQYQDLDALGQRPTSHGCIRIHPDEARWFTFWGPHGVPVIITEWTGGDSIAQVPAH